MNFVVTLLLLCLAATVQADADHAASSTPEHVRQTRLRRGAIADIEVRGQRKVETDAVRANLRSRVGELPDSQLLRDDIRRIYNMGFFDDVKLLSRPRDDGSLILIFELSEKPAVREIVFEGNDKVSEDDIKEVVDVKAFEVLDIPKLQRNVDKIQKLYVDKGYYLAEVRYDIRPASGARAERREAKPAVRKGRPPGGTADRPQDRELGKTAVDRVEGIGTQVDVAFVIVERAKVQIERITFVGNKALLDDDIKPYLATKEGTLISFFTEWGTYKEEDFSVDLMKIEALYHDHGYINVKVGKPRVRLSPDKRKMFVSIPIEEGEQFRLGSKQVTGDLIEDADSLIQSVTLEPGEIFKRSQIAQDIDAVASKYKDVGYAYVNVSPLTKLDPEKRTVELNLEIEKGPLVTLERIEIKGNDKTRDKVIRRELRIYEGELYTATGLRESEGRVRALGYFETVDFGTRRGSTADRIIVTITVKEKSTGTFQVSFGFSSYEQFVGQAQVVQDNFLGYGTRLSLTGQLSQRRRIFDFQFTDPYFMDSRWSFSFNLFNTENDYYDFRRASSGGDLTWGYPMDFGIPYLDKVYVYLGPFVERVEIPEEAFNVTLSGLETNTPRWTSALRGTVAFDNRDNRLFPTDGYYALLRAEWASPYLLSETVFTRITGIGRGYWPLWWGLVFKANLRVGWIDSPDRIPVFESYRAGGYGSIRGFYTRSIGPIERVGGLDPANRLTYFNVGGNKDFLTNIELEFPIVEQVGIRGVLFFDMANTYGADQSWFYLGQTPNPALSGEVWDPVRDLPFGVYSSVGFGVRWISPIGPLRFEWGFPLTRRPAGTRGLSNGDELFLFEFNIGNSF